MEQHGDLLKTTWSEGTSTLKALFLLTSFTYSMHSPAAVVLLEDCRLWRVKIKKRRYPSLDVPLLVYSIANGIDDELPDFISCEKLVFGFF